MGTKSTAPVKKILVVVLIVILGLAASVYWSRMRDAPEPVKKTQEVFGPAVTVIPGVQPPSADQVPVAEDVCKENRKKLEGLFAYLDRQDYVVSHQLKEGSFEHFKSLLARLLETPPSVLLETDSILKVLQNRAHFYRVLGKKDTLLLREILRKEGDIMESFFAILYQTFALQEKCRVDGLTLHVPLQKVYPYSVLLLNTLGGASYLMRRDARVRMLTRYYSILILDQANRQRFNKLGLDIRPPIDLLMGDLNGTANLTRKNEYIDTLKSIRARY